MRRMVRPCYLVVDAEHGGSISTRKLVIETAKLNVITAYSGAEAIETLEKYPALDAAVVDTAIADMPCGALVDTLKRLRPDLPVVVVGSPGVWRCEAADYMLESFEPTRLLELLKSMQPGPVAAIVARDSAVAADGR